MYPSDLQGSTCICNLLAGLEQCHGLVDIGQHFGGFRSREWSISIGCDVPLDSIDRDIERSGGDFPSRPTSCILGDPFQAFLLEFFNQFHALLIVWIQRHIRLDRRGQCFGIVSVCGRGHVRHWNTCSLVAHL